MPITKKVASIAGFILGTLGVVAVIHFCVFGRDSLMPYVLKEKTWTATDFNAFLDHCNDKRLNALSKSLKTNNASVADIKKEFLWQSSNLLVYPFKDAESIDYHEVVKWIAGKCDVPQDTIDTAPTFALERKIMEYSFKEIWDSLSVKQRTELIQKIDTQGKLNSAEIAAMGGTAALATLSASVYFAGFAFYTTMSTVICSVAGFFGVSLPFAAYSGASTTVAVLSGPVGWTLIVIGAAGSLAFLGKANWRNCMAFIIQVHCIKVDALQRSGVPIK